MDNSALATIMAKLDIMGAQLTTQLAKSELLESAITNLRADMAVVVNASAKKDKIITRHSEQINNCEQALRATSIRILGLPVKKDDSSLTILNTVYDTILHPVLIAASQKGELDPPFPSRRFLIDSAFAIPCHCEVFLCLCAKSCFFVQKRCPAQNPGPNLSQNPCQICYIRRSNPR